MRPGRASSTAQHNALFRALETREPPSRRVCADPLATAFLSLPLRAVATAGRVAPVRAAVARTIDARWPGVRTSVVARTRLIDDLVTALAAAVDQVVVLGAGFDTRATRLPALAGVPVVEVDHPDTQARKRAVLARAGVSPPHVRFAPVDLRTRDLAQALSAAGHDPGARTLMLCEGVTNYLAEGDVDAVLRWCGTAAAGSRLVFTYVHERVLRDPDHYAGARRLRATLRRAGEALTFGMDPSAMPGYLADRGLTLTTDEGAAAYRARCYGARAVTMRGHEFYRVATATVP